VVSQKPVYEESVEMLPCPAGDVANEN
jgi:hypothetical protein